MGANYRKATITGAQILTLNGSPVNVVLAPGDDKWLLPAQVLYEYVSGNGSLNSNRNLTLQTDIDPTSWHAAIAAVFSNNAPYPFYTRPAAFTNTSFGGDVIDNGGLRVIASGSNTVATPIVTASVNVGGADYVVGDTGTIDSPEALTPAGYEVLTVDGGGAVLTFTVTPNDGTYFAGDTRTTTPGGGQPGIGTGFTVNIDTVEDYTGYLLVHVWYNILAIP